jgi:hypothetical protein
VARHVRPGIDPEKVAETSSRLASQARSALTGRAFWPALGSPRATAVLAVLGHRIVNYWLPLPPGAIGYLRLRLRPGADGKRKGKGKPVTVQPG